MINIADYMTVKGQITALLEKRIHPATQMVVI